MTVTVELFGIPRQRAGAAQVEIDGARLGEVLTALVARYPPLGNECIADGQLQPGYLANLNGRRFIADPNTELQSGDALLILSADAGG